MYIEFFGAPGVGKSELFNSINWSDYNIKTEKNHTYKTNATDEILECKFYQHLAETGLQYIEKLNPSPIEKYKLACYFYKIIRQDYIIRKLLYKNYNLVSEEGILHNLGYGIREYKKQEPEELMLLMKNRVFVYCTALPETTADRIISRKKTTGKILPQHKNIPREELIKISKKELAECQLSAQFLERNNITCLHINTELPTSENISTIKSFLNHTILDTHH